MPSLKSQKDDLHLGASPSYVRLIGILQISSRIRRSGLHSSCFILIGLARLHEPSPDVV